MAIPSPETFVKILAVSFLAGFSAALIFPKYAVNFTLKLLSFLPTPKE